MTREFRFGVLRGGVDSLQRSTVTAVTTAHNGSPFDARATSVSMTGHIRSVAPFPALAAAAASDFDDDVGTACFNVGFYKPACSHVMPLSRPPEFWASSTWVFGADTSKRSRGRVNYPFPMATASSILYSARHLRAPSAQACRC